MKKTGDTKQRGFYLIPGFVLEVIAERLWLGKNKKYKRWTVKDYDIYFDALSRHFVELQKGKKVDEDGFSHLSGIMTNAAILLDIDNQKKTKATC